MRLIIEGDKKYLEIIKRENRLRAIRYGLKMSIEEKIKKDESKEDIPGPVKQPVKKQIKKTGTKRK